MTKKEFLGLVEEILEVDAGSLTGEEEIADLAGWDSLAVVSFIAMIDEELDLTLKPDQIAQAKSLQELMNLLGDNLTN
jgi:acyl carrier protein